MSKTLQEFKNIFNEEEDIRAVRSPLRIAPLGAHSDHQDGRVTGMALDASIDLVYSPNEDGLVNVHSLDFEGEEKFPLDADELDFIPGFWGNYLRGVVTALQKDYELTVGINGLLNGELPIGGLSSSAAVLTAYLMALCDVNGIELSKLDLVHYNSMAERNFMGLKNGILDQSSNILSQDDHLLVMDCQTNDYDLVPKGDDFPEFEVVVVFSGVTQQLTDSGFNNRTDECRVAGWVMQEWENIYNGGEVTPLDDVRLRDIAPDVYEKYKNDLPGRFGRRAEHFYTEQARVLEGREAWANGDIETFGELMFASSDSTFNNYETGIPEMATIIRVLREMKGVYGARPSGAGFRGSVIGLIDPAHKDEIKEAIDAVFPEEHPEYADVYEVNFVGTADGASYVNDLGELK
jgi:galactokinase/galacturonokinase